jgi:hypothetical protein
LKNLSAKKLVGKMMRNLSEKEIVLKESQRGGQFKNFDVKLKKIN